MSYGFEIQSGIFSKRRKRGLVFSVGYQFVMMGMSDCEISSSKIYCRNTVQSRIR